MNSIAYLRNAAPDWIDINPVVLSEINCVANSHLPSGTPGSQYSLRIYETNGKLKVCEHSNSTVLPACCVERHINDDGTFCTFYGSVEPLSDHDGAVRWWKGLKQFLSDQAYAEKHRKWPSHRSMSHGDAADIQLEMEKLADELGWIDETLSGMFRKNGWLGGTIRRAKKKNSKIVNQRGPCPRGCRYRHAPNLQKDCAKIGCSQSCNKRHSPVLLVDCPNREIVNQLVIKESERRDREAAYVRAISKKGIRCCGKMDGCPLR